MARDPLMVLQRLRDAAVTEARRNLAAALADEMRQARRLDEHRRQIRCEQSEAEAGNVAAFADWLPYAQQRAVHLQAALASEQARVAHLQQVLVGRRTEAEAVAKALQRQQQEVEQMQARKEQGVMDEAAGRRIGQKAMGRA